MKKQVHKRQWFADCYENGKIVNECVFCSGRATNCSNFWSIRATAESDYTGAAVKTLVHRAQQMVFVVKTSFTITFTGYPWIWKDMQQVLCASAKGLILTIDWPLKNVFIVLMIWNGSSYLELPPKKSFWRVCASSCKGSDGSICNSFGDCRSNEVVGLGGSRSCNTDSTAMSNNPFIEDSNYFCKLEKIPGFWKDVDNSDLPTMFDWERLFIKIRETSWTSFATIHGTTMPQSCTIIVVHLVQKLVRIRLWTR